MDDPARPGNPVKLHGKPAVIALGLFASDPADSTGALSPFAERATPLLDLGGAMPYADPQCSADELFPSATATTPSHTYSKSHFADEISNDAIHALVTSFERRPNAESLVVVGTPRDAVDEVTSDESAYPHQGRRFDVSFDAAWSHPNDDTRAVSWLFAIEPVTWARDSWTVYRSFAAGGVYVNFSGFGTDARLIEKIETSPSTVAATSTASEASTPARATRKGMPAARSPPSRKTMAMNAMGHR